MRAHDQRKIDELLSGIDHAQQCGDPAAVQRVYEELFTFCRKNNLDLDALLRQPRRTPASGLLGALKALWPTS
jgi:hypothetical protein